MGGLVVRAVVDAGSAFGRGHHDRIKTEYSGMVSSDLRQPTEFDPRKCRLTGPLLTLGGRKDINERRRDRETCAHLFIVFGHNKEIEAGCFLGSKQARSIEIVSCHSDSVGDARTRVDAMSLDGKVDGHIVDYRQAHVLFQEFCVGRLALSGHRRRVLLASRVPHAGRIQRGVVMELGRVYGSGHGLGVGCCCCCGCWVGALDT